MRCIKHVIRYISIKQLWNLSKYVLNNKGCRWLTDWTKEQRLKELMEGIEGPSSENWEDSWVPARIWYMYLHSGRAEIGSRPTVGLIINLEIQRPGEARTLMKDWEVVAHKSAPCPMFSISLQQPPAFQCPAPPWVSPTVGEWTQCSKTKESHDM